MEIDPLDCLQQEFPSGTNAAGGKKAACLVGALHHFCLGLSGVFTELFEQSRPDAEEVIQSVEHDLLDIVRRNAPYRLITIGPLLLMGDVVAVAFPLLAGMAG